MTDDDDAPRVKLKFEAPDGTAYYVEAPIPADVARMFADGLNRVDVEVVKLKRSRRFMLGSGVAWLCAAAVYVGLIIGGLL